MILVILLLILLIVAAESTAMATLKKSSASDNAEFWFIVGALMYGIVAILLRETFHYEKIGVVNGMWSALSVIAAIAVGKVVYNESLKTKEIIAIALATVAAIMLGK